MILNLQGTGRFPSSFATVGWAVLIITSQSMTSSANICMQGVPPYQLEIFFRKFEREKENKYKILNGTEDVFV